VTVPEPTSAEMQEAGTMLGWANDAYGNAGLVYGRCDEHGWRGRKRNVNGIHRDGFDIRWAAITDAAYHLAQKHRPRP
jgi:hypothetical protein